MFWNKNIKKKKRNRLLVETFFSHFNGFIIIIVGNITPKNITIATSATSVSGSTHQYAGRSGGDEEEHYGLLNADEITCYCGVNLEDVDIDIE